MNTVYIMRHAEKEIGEFYNPVLRHQDNPISARGQAHAEELCAYLADKDITAIYVSGYQRTWQTAAPLARRLGLTPVQDARLNEIDTGCVEQMPDAEIAQRYPEMWAAYTSRQMDFRFPEGETGAEARDRVAAFLEEQRSVLNHGNIVAICHEGLIRALLTHVLGMPVYYRRKFKVDFCGVTELRYFPDEGEWKVVRFNR